MRRVLLLTLLALALPIAAAASGIDLTNQFGTVSITGMTGTLGMGTIGVSTLTSKGSQMHEFDGMTTTSLGVSNLGFVHFSTGVLLSGSILNGGTFSATGSTFTVIGSNHWALGHGTAIFTGSFVGPVQWNLISVGPHGQVRNYQLVGLLVGTLFDGRTVEGMTKQNISMLTTAQGLVGDGHMFGGSTLLAVPEPGTLGLLGTGLVGLAGMFRRKLIGV